MKDVKILRHNGGDGLFGIPLSTSNLYQPNMDRLLRYLDGYRSAITEKYSISDLLEKRLSEYHKSEYCVLFSSGFWALVLAIKLKAIERKNNVIIPSMTYRRLADVIHWAGKTPVFVDVNKDNLAVSVDAVNAAIDDDTSLILAVHPIVNCCDVNGFIDLSEKTNIPLLIDAVESVHETYDGRRIGSFGCGEVFSFHASKLINGCEGGYVCTDNQKFSDQLRALRGMGVVDKVGGRIIGVDSVPLDEHSAFALAGLDEIDVNVQHNKDIYYRYRQNLAGTSGLKIVEFDEKEQTSYKNIVLEVLEDFPCSRDELVKFLNAEGVLARSHYDPPLHLKEYSYNVIVKDMRNTNIKHKRYINMPCGSAVSLCDVDDITKILMYIIDESPC